MLKLISDIQGFLDHQQEVDVTLSLVDFIKKMNQAFHNDNKNYYKIPDNRRLISQYLLLYDSNDLEDFVNSTYSQARISARLSIHSSLAQRDLIHKINKYLTTITNDKHIKMRVTGKALQDVLIIDSLVNGQIVSLITASTMIGICMLAVFRSFSLGILSFIPNLFPLLINFGIMGALKIPLNTATALISTVALGIVVDDTIHFITEYKEQRQKNRSIVDSVHRVIVKKGRAIITTSLILSAGFLVLVLSDFIPTIQFGLLSAIIILTAVIGDLVILPATILLFQKQRIF